MVLLACRPIVIVIIKDYTFVNVLDGVAFGLAAQTEFQLCHGLIHAGASITQLKVIVVGNGDVFEVFVST